MFKNKGQLLDYWHVLAPSKELSKNNSTRIFIYHVPLLVWRDSVGLCHAVLDACSHKRSILNISNFEENEITCPYHGWKYDKSGKLIEIPSISDTEIHKMKCRLSTFRIKEKYGLIWVYLNENEPREDLVFDLDHESDQKWEHIFLRQTFETTENLLIENFMDATHTAFTHAGIIRGHGNKVEHHITINTHEKGLKVMYEETTEKIGLALGLILGQNLRVSHTDEFLFPNLVKVTYTMNDIIRFTAVISCTSSLPDKTEAVVRLAFNFKRLNPIIKLVLPFLAKKVLQQDFEITQQQFVNQQLFSEVKDHHINTDVIYNKVNNLRKAKIRGTNTIEQPDKKISFYL